MKNATIVFQWKLQGEICSKTIVSGLGLPDDRTFIYFDILPVSAPAQSFGVTPAPLQGLLSGENPPTVISFDTVPRP